MATPIEPTVDQLQTWLTEAIAAKHAFATGKQAVEVWYLGRKIQYSNSKQDIAKLDAYISQLKEQILADGCPRRRRAGRVRF